ncbi:unnamed protein product, partial [Dicrocoelium dendriticum]
MPRNCLLASYTVASKAAVSHFEFSDAAAFGFTLSSIVPWKKSAFFDPILFDNFSFRSFRFASSASLYYRGNTDRAPACKLSYHNVPRGLRCPVVFFRITNRYNPFKLVTESFSSTFSSSYVALTKSGQFNLHLDSDPSVMSTQLVGIWVSGMTSVMDPRVWAVCLRFLLSQQCSQCRPMDSTVLSSDTSMFLVFYGAVADRPSCFEVDWVNLGPDGVATANAEISNDRIEKLLQFNVYTGSEKILHSPFSTPGNAKDHVLLMNIAPAGGYSLSVPSRVTEHHTPSHTRPDTNETIPKRPTEHNSTLLSERHESQPQPSVSDYLSFVPEFNVPDASLLLEEGVTISDVQPNGLSANLWTSFPADVSKLDTPAVDSLASDSVPRPLPSSQALAVHDKVVHPMVHRKSFYTIDEHDVSGTYDPVRYKEVSESSSIAASHPSCSSANSPAPNQPASGATNSKSPEHNRSAIHTILASLPASQLKRLEKMISGLLDKKGQSKSVPLSSAKSNGIVCGESSSIHPSHLVDAAVNTSKVFAGDPALSSHGRQQRFTDDQTCIRSNSKRSDDQPHIRPLPTAPSAGSNCSHASVSTRSLRVVSSSIEENKQPPRPIRTLAELRPMLRLQSNTNAHSSPSLNSRDPEADKYSMLLANIKCVLDRHSSGTSPVSKSASVAGTRATTAIHTERPPPQAIVTEWGDSVCDYPLHRFPLLNSHHTANPLAHSRSCQSLPSEPLGSITHRSSARDRVTGWLHAGTSIESVVQRGTRAYEEHESTQLSDETLISRLLFPTPCGQK